MQISVEFRGLLRKQMPFPGAFGQHVHPFSINGVKVD